MNSKIYRCGWCGSPTNESGIVLDTTLFKRVVELIKKYGDYRTHKRNGDCCRHEYQ